MPSCPLILKGSLSFITTQLCQAVTFLGSDLGFLPSEVSACLLHADGVMAPLVANIDIDIIQLLGHWCSDEMFQYLHLIAELITKSFAIPILHADYHLVPCPSAKTSQPPTLFP